MYDDRGKRSSASVDGPAGSGREWHQQQNDCGIPLDFSDVAHWLPHDMGVSLLIARKGWCNTVDVG